MVGCPVPVSEHNWGSFSTAQCHIFNSSLITIVTYLLLLCYRYEHCIVIIIWVLGFISELRRLSKTTQ